MWLLNATSHRLKGFFGNSIPSYAILSHTWGEEEVLYDDVQQGKGHIKKGWAKVEGCCRKAREHDYDWVWIDTCCIDKSSSAELSEAINSMFAWYRDAAVCYAYLEDVKAVHKARPGPKTELIVPYRRRSEKVTYEMEDISKSRWFTRGWTLQELVAPSAVEFYSAEWTELGTKRSMRDLISSITGIPAQILAGAAPSTCSIAQRMSWVSLRRTTRVEDMAYCLLGIFDINMPLLYGEGSKAFIRLQTEILRQEEDYSIFAWCYPGTTDISTGFLTTSPFDFSHNAQNLASLPTVGPGLHDYATIRSSMMSLPTEQYEMYKTIPPWSRADSADPKQYAEPAQITSRGLKVTLPITAIDIDIPAYFFAWIFCEGADGNLICVLLKERESKSRQYVRCLPGHLFILDREALSKFQRREIYLHPAGEVASSDKTEASPTVVPKKMSLGVVRLKFLKNNLGYSTRVLKMHPKHVFINTLDGADELTIDAYDRSDSGIATVVFECSHVHQPTRIFLVSVGLAEGLVPWCRTQLSTTTDGPVREEVLENQRAGAHARSDRSWEFLHLGENPTIADGGRVVLLARIRKGPATRRDPSLEQGQNVPVPASTATDWPDPSSVLSVEAIASDGAGPWVTLNPSLWH